MLTRFDVPLFYLMVVAVTKGSSLTYHRDHYIREDGEPCEKQTVIRTHDELLHDENNRLKRFPFRKIVPEAHPNKLKDNGWDSLGDVDKGREVVHVPCPKRKMNNIVLTDTKSGIPYSEHFQERDFPSRHSHNHDKVTRDLFKSKSSVKSTSNSNQNDPNQCAKHQQQWLIFSAHEKSPNQNAINYDASANSIVDNHQSRFKAMVPNVQLQVPNNQLQQGVPNYDLRIVGSAVDAKSSKSSGAQSQANVMNNDHYYPSPKQHGKNREKVVNNPQMMRGNPQQQSSNDPKGPQGNEAPLPESSRTAGVEEHFKYQANPFNLTQDKPSFPGWGPMQQFQQFPPQSPASGPFQFKQGPMQVSPAPNPKTFAQGPPNMVPPNQKGMMPPNMMPQTPMNQKFTPNISFYAQGPMPGNPQSPKPLGTMPSGKNIGGGIPHPMAEVGNSGLNNMGGGTMGVPNKIIGGNSGSPNMGEGNFGGTNNMAGGTFGGANPMAGGNFGGANNMAGGNFGGTNMAGGNLGGNNMAGGNLGGGHTAGGNFGGPNKMAGGNIVPPNMGEAGSFKESYNAAGGANLDANPKSNGTKYHPPPQKQYPTPPHSNLRLPDSQVSPSSVKATNQSQRINSLQGSGKKFSEICQHNHQHAPGVSDPRDGKEPAMLEFADARKAKNHYYDSLGVETLPGGNYNEQPVSARLDHTSLVKSAQRNAKDPKMPCSNGMKDRNFEETMNNGAPIDSGKDLIGNPLADASSNKDHVSQPMANPFMTNAGGQQIVNEKRGSEMDSRNLDNNSNPLLHVMEPPVTVETNLFTNRAFKMASKVPSYSDNEYHPFRGFMPARNDETFYDKNMNFLGRIVHPPLVNIKREKSAFHKKNRNINYYNWYPRVYPGDYFSEPVDFQSISEIKAEDLGYQQKGAIGQRKVRKCGRSHQSLWHHLRGQDKRGVHRSKGTS